MSRTRQTQRLLAFVSLLRVGTANRGAECLETADAPVKAAQRIHHGGTILHWHSSDDCSGGRPGGAAASSPPFWRLHDVFSWR